MGRIIATTSGKGGVGKSTVATGLAFAFCKLGQKVLLVDMDEGLGCLDLLLGIDSTAVLDLGDILAGTPAEDAVYHCNEQNLFLIPAPSRFGQIDPDKFTKFVKEVKKNYDIVIFDFPAGLDFTLYSCLPETSLFLTVAVADPVSIRDAAAVSDRLYELGLKSRLIINRFKVKAFLAKKYKNIDGIIDSAGLRLIGLVPDAKELNTLSVTHTIKKRCPAMKSFLRIANRLLGVNIPLPKLKKI